jgi:hypothetical protein
MAACDGAEAPLNFPLDTDQSSHGSPDRTLRGRAPIIPGCRSFKVTCRPRIVSTAGNTVAHAAGAEVFDDVVLPYLGTWRQWGRGGQGLSWRLQICRRQA